MIVGKLRQTGLWGRVGVPNPKGASVMDAYSQLLDRKYTSGSSEMIPNKSAEHALQMQLKLWTAAKAEKLPVRILSSRLGKATEQDKDFYSDLMPAAEAALDAGCDVGIVVREYDKRYFNRDFANLITSKGGAVKVVEPGKAIKNERGPLSFTLVGDRMSRTCFDNATFEAFGNFNNAILGEMLKAKYAAFERVSRNWNENPAL